MFGLKEYIGTDGEIKNTVEIRNFRSKDKINEAKMPKVAKINGQNDLGYDTYEMVDYDEYIANRSNKVNSNGIDPFKEFGETVEIDNLLD